LYVFKISHLEHDTWTFEEKKIEGIKLTIENLEDQSSKKFLDGLKIIFDIFRGTKIIFNPNMILGRWHWKKYIEVDILFSYI
jgi:hypothetical protein